MRVAAHLWPDPEDKDKRERVLRITGIWGGLSDRVAFERQFGIAWKIQVEHMVRAAREDRDDPTRRDERGAYMAWRMLRRAHPGEEVLKDFDEFVDATREIEIERLDVVIGRGGEERVDPSLDPTVPRPPTETSPS